MVFIMNKAGKCFESKLNNETQIKGPFRCLDIQTKEASASIRDNPSLIEVRIGDFHMDKRYWMINISDRKPNQTHYIELIENRIERISETKWTQNRKFPFPITQINEIVQYFPLLQDISKFILTRYTSRELLNMSFINQLNLLASDNNQKLLLDYETSHLKKQKAANS